MNRVWLSIPMLLVLLVGPQWLAAPARGENETPYPSADMGCGGQGVCPDVEKMRAYGECPWYYDEEYHHGGMPDVTSAVTDMEPSDPAVEEGEAADEATTAAEATTTNATAGPADCWYDGATDSYHDYEFSNADMIREETVETTETTTETEAVESYAVEAADEATETDDDWNGSYEFPSETVVSDDSAEDSYWADDVAEADCDDESMSYGDESYVERVCREPAADTASAATEADFATEEAWHGDYSAEYAYPTEGTEYPYGDASESEMAKTQSAETMEESEEVMEGTWSMDTAEAEANESPADWSSGEYEDDYSADPYRYDHGRDIYGAPVPTWGEPGENVQGLEGEDSEEFLAAPATSTAVEFDSEVILSLARTLDRIGVTLQSLSQYLTEMATADVAKRHGAALER